MTIFAIILILIAVYCALGMSIVDWRHRLIPDVYLFPFMLVGILLVAMDALPWTNIMYSAIAGFFGYFMAFFLNILFRKKTKKDDAIGMGDIKLLGASGVWLGVFGLSIALIISCILGYIWGRRNGQEFVPFAPFFFAGMLVSIGFLLW